MDQLLPGYLRRRLYGTYIQNRNRRLYGSRNDNVVRYTIDTRPRNDNISVVKNKPPTGLSIKEINQSSDVHICKQESFCAICQDIIQSNDQIERILNCKHTYHIQCIDTWLSEKTWCPICKSTLKLN